MASLAATQQCLRCDCLEISGIPVIPLDNPQNNNTDSTNPSDEVKRFRCKETNGRDAALDAFINAIENDIMACKPTPIRNKLSRNERKALTILRKRTNI